MATTTRTGPKTRRTGLRTPVNYLKVWASSDWTRRLTPRLRVAMVDEELPPDKVGGRKSWYLALTQDRDLLKALGPVHGVRKNGKTLLLFEDDVVALVQHLMDAGLVQSDDGRVVNGPAAEREELLGLLAARHRRAKGRVKRSRRRR